MKLALDVLAVVILGAVVVAYGYAVFHVGAQPPAALLVGLLLVAWAFNRVAGRLL